MNEMGINGIGLKRHVFGTRLGCTINKHPTRSPFNNRIQLLEGVYCVLGYKIERKQSSNSV